MKYKQAKRNLTLFRVASVGCLIFAVIAIGCAVGRILLRNQAYAQMISISAATDQEAKIKSYRRAIALDPEKPDAFLLLLDIYNEDGIFEKAESEEFISLYNNYHRFLNKKDESYAKLHYTVGFLYANGYEGTSTTRLRMSLPFFSEASQYISKEDPNALSVISYNKIGNYYSYYIWDASSAVREVSASEMQDLVEDISLTLQAYMKNTSPDTVFNRLGYSEAVCNLFFDQRDTLAATVPQEDVTAILELIYDNLPAKDAVQKDQIRVLLESLLANKEMYVDMIDRAYNRKGGDSLAD